MTCHVATCTAPATIDATSLQDTLGYRVRTYCAVGHSHWSQGPRHDDLEREMIALRTPGPRTHERHTGVPAMTPVSADSYLWRLASARTRRDWACACGAKTHHPGRDGWEWRWLRVEEQSGVGRHTMIRCAGCARGENRG